MLARFFVYRPVFAIVIAIVIMLMGVISIFTLPMEQYPDIAPPTVNINATYTGASAETVENSVTQVIEKELTGLDGLLYFASTSNSAGRTRINLTFEQGTDPDTAQIQVQNRVQQIMRRLPTVVQQNGVTVTKARTNMLMLAVVYDETNRDNNADVADYLVNNVQDPLSRIEGVGSVNLFGQQYAMRIWLNPTKLRSYNLMPSDVISAIEEQNVQVSAGKIGDLPAVENQNFTATVTALSMLETPEQFRNIIVKHNVHGASVRIKDVALVELGSEAYGTVRRFNGHPAAALQVQLASGANAMSTSNAIYKLMEELQRVMPEGYKVSYANDNSKFVKLSIIEVVKTLIEAIILVVIVMYVFLRSWRATIIPALTVPVVLLGTFAILELFGYSINTLTLFAMVLSIGLLVDDTIVVVENVERNMRDKKLGPKEATVASMEEVTGALIGIATVLSVVFIPMMFFGGSSGIIYRQFAITIISSMGLSVVMALTFTPALCAAILKPQKEEHEGWFQRNFDKLLRNYEGGVAGTLKRPVRWILAYGLIAFLAFFILAKMPTGFIPNEDQGILLVQFSLPEGADISRTLAIGRQIEEYFLTEEKDNTAAIFSNSGSSFNTSGQNSGMAFINLKDWSERKGASSRAGAIAAKATRNLSKIRDARIFVLVPPSIRGLGQADGFELYLQAAGSTSRNELNALREEIMTEASASPVLSRVRSDTSTSAPQLHIDFNKEAALAYGIQLRNIYNTLNTAWAGSYVNDFVDRSRIKRVYVQGEAPYRSKPEDLYSWTVRNSKGEMVPFSAFTTFSWKYDAQALERFNGLPAYYIQGTASDDASSGQAMETIKNIIEKMPGVLYSWSGASYQENQTTGQSAVLYALSVLVIFLCLAALYESWSVPIAVLMVIPLGVVGAVLASSLRGLENNVYFQMAFLTTIGLSAKNSIMMVEFSESMFRKGKRLSKAAIDGAVLRLRPILMTSLAFVAGVIPLAISTGIGANSRIAIGTGIVGGTITATVLSVFLVPLFFVLVNRVFGAKNKER